MSAEFTWVGTGETGTGGGDHHAGVLPPSVCVCLEFRMPGTKPHLIFIRLWLTGARCSYLQGAYHRKKHLFLFSTLFNEMCASMLTYMLVCK